MNDDAECLLPPCRLALLPHEIKLEILDYVLAPLLATRDYVRGGLSGLANLCLVSSAWYCLCVPYLYSRIRLPRTRTPEGCDEHTRVYTGEETAPLLARTMEAKPELAQLIKDLEINARWFQDESFMQQAAGAYSTIINLATHALSIAFCIPCTEYSNVLPTVPSQHPTLKTLIIGVERIERDLKLRLLQKTRSSWMSARQCPETGKTELESKVFFIAPMLTNLQLFLPKYLDLNEETAALIRDALPPQLTHLDIYLGATLSDKVLFPKDSDSSEEGSTSEQETRLSTEQSRSTATLLRRQDFLDTKIAAILQLCTTQDVPHDRGYDIVKHLGMPLAVPDETAIPKTHRLRSLTLHFADRRSYSASTNLYSLLGDLRACPEIAHLGGGVEVRIAAFPRNGEPQADIDARGYDPKLRDSAVFRLMLEDPERERRLREEVLTSFGDIKWVAAEK